jgi:hypothetical protein
MGWMDQIGNLLQQYVGASPQQPSGNAETDFDDFARSAPPPAVAQGLADAFRSDQTPPFAQMVSQLFAQSDSGQRAGLLNTLTGAVGPQVVSQILGGSGLSGLGALFGGGQGQVSPHQADQLPPEVVQQLAAHAEQHNPSVIDQVSGFFAQHPGVVKGLGAGALTAALSGLAQRQARGEVLPASQDPYGDPADQFQGQQVQPASQDPYGDPADELAGAQVLPASQDPYGDPADDPRNR